MNLALRTSYSTGNKEKLKPCKREARLCYSAHIAYHIVTNISHTFLPTHFCIRISLYHSHTHNTQTRTHLHYHAIIQAQSLHTLAYCSSCLTGTAISDSPIGPFLLLLALHPTVFLAYFSDISSALFSFSPALCLKLYY